MRRMARSPLASTSWRGVPGDEVGQVLQRVVEVVLPERRELEVLAHLRRDRWPVVRPGHRRPRRAGRLEVVAPHPAPEAELTGLGRLPPALPRDAPRLVEPP